MGGGARASKPCPEKTHQMVDERRPHESGDGCEERYARGSHKDAREATQWCSVAHTQCLCGRGCFRCVLGEDARRALIRTTHAPCIESPFSKQARLKMKGV